MLPFFGISAIVIASLATPSTPAQGIAAAHDAQIVAAAPAQRTSDQQAVTVQRPATPAKDDRAERIERYEQMHLIFPPGNGGG
jgi:hypothetical protein